MVRLNQWIGMLMCLMVLAFASGVQAQERVAVLELTNASKLSTGTMNYVTQRVRGVVAEELGSKFQVLTKENILRLVDEQTCDEAAGASCEVEVWCAVQEAAAKHAERRGSVGEGRGACPS